MCSYALVATSTDYDAWRTNAEPVTAAEVFKTLKGNSQMSRHIAETILDEMHAATLKGDMLEEVVGSMQFSIMPRTVLAPAEDIKKLNYILPTYFHE